MRTILALALAAGALGLPGALSAAELSFGVDGAAEYDSNVFRSHEDEKDDVVFRLRPFVQLDEERGQDLSYTVGYGLPVEFAVEHTEVDDVDQELYSNATYHVNDRLELFGNESFRYLRSELRTNLEGTESSFDSPLINNERDRVLVNIASVGARYQFTPRLGGSATLGHDLFDPSRNDRQQYWQLSGTAETGYTVTPKLRLGGGATAAYQKFDESQDIVGSTAQIYNVFASGRYAFDEKTEFSASVGPAIIRSEQDDADEIKVRGLIPFTRRGGGFTAPGGFVNINGLGVGGVTFDEPVVLVSQFVNCPELRDDPQQRRVLVSDKNCNVSVVLVDNPGADGPLIDEIEDATASVINDDPDGENSTDITVFADVVLTRNWTPTLHSALRYSREQGGASGLGGTVVGDSVVLSNTWDITEKWQVSARGEWGLRKSISQAGQVNTFVEEVNPSDFVGGPPPGTLRLAGLSGAVVNGTGESFVQRDTTTEIDTMRWGAAARLTRIFTHNTSGYLQFTYNQQGSQNDSLGDPSDFDDYLVTLGVQHVFTPIKLW